MISITVKYDDYMKPLDSKIIRKVAKDLVVEEGKEVKGLYDGLMSNFTSKNRSRMLRKFGSGRSPIDGQKGSVYVAVGTNRMDGPLVWLEDGTDIRYRRLSGNWISKTRPGGGLSVRGGRGMALGFDMAGFPGIKPRYFRDDIIKKRYPTFIVNSSKAFDSMFKSAGWY